MLPLWHLFDNHSKGTTPIMQTELIITLVVLQVAFAIWALTDLFKRYKNEKKQDVTLWALMIVGTPILGVWLYFNTIYRRKRQFSLRRLNSLEQDFSFTKVYPALLLLGIFLMTVSALYKEVNTLHLQDLGIFAIGLGIGLFVVRVEQSKRQTL